MIDSALPTLFSPWILSSEKIDSTIEDTQSVAFTGIRGYADFLTGAIGKALTGTYFYFNMPSILEDIKQNPSKLTEILSYCKITKEEDLKTIALALLEKDYKTLALCLPDFGIQDQDFLKELELKLDECFKTHNIISSTLKNRLATAAAELSRLSQDLRIQKSLQKIESSHYYYDPLTAAQKVAIAQSIELRENLKDTYYVINHGQNNSGIIANILAKKVNELFEAKKYEYFEVLRHDVFLQGISKKQDVAWYKKKMEYGSDHDYRNEIICGDIQLENTTSYESAIDFFAFSKNIAAAEDYNFTQRIIEKIAGKYFQSDKKLVEQVSKELTDLSKGLTGGTLYSICIPKTKFDSVGYLSGPFGHPLHDTFTSDDLDSLQDGLSSISTQARLLTAKLDPKEDIFILPHSTLSIKELRKIEGIVENCLLGAKKQLEFIV